MTKVTESTDGHSCMTYDDECICETCECDVSGYPKCKTCNKYKGMML